MNGGSGHNTNFDDDDNNWSKYRPYLTAAGIIVGGICVGYLAVRCLESPDAPTVTMN